MSRRAVAAGLFLAALTVYLHGFRYAGSGDTRPAELLPIALLHGDGFDFREFVEAGRPLPYWFQERRGRIVSIYPVVPGLLNVPAFAAARAAGTDLVAGEMRLSMITASVVSALSVAFLFIALDRLARRRTAVVLAAAYAFGTCAWSVASRGLFQHGPSLLFQTIAIALIVRGSRASLAWSGFFLALAVADRPTNLLIAIPLAFVVARKRRDAVLPFLLFAAVPTAAKAAYAAVYWGSPFSLAQTDPFPTVSNFGGNMARGLAGLLVSPSRGLLIFSPFLAFAAFAALPAFRRRREEPIYLALLAGAAAILLVTAKWRIWWGGHSFGYRLLIEMLPAVVVSLVLLDDAKAHPFRDSVFVACLAWSVFLNGFGAGHQPTGFNQRLDADPSVLWSVRESDPARALRWAAGAPSG